MFSKSKDDLFEWLVLIFGQFKATKVDFYVFDHYNSKFVMIGFYAFDPFNSNFITVGENSSMLLFDSCRELPSEKFML